MSIVASDKQFKITFWEGGRFLLEYFATNLPFYQISQRITLTRSVQMATPAGQEAFYQEMVERLELQKDTYEIQRIEHEVAIVYRNEEAQLTRALNIYVKRT